MIEVLKQALEAWQTSVYGSDKHHKAMLLAMTKMNQAIAELESQEPVAWMSLMKEARDNCKASIVEDGISEMRKEYRIDLERRLTDCINTHPPQRTWVGLTDEEIAQGCKESWVTEQAWQSAVWWAEAKLKEKNTDAVLKTGVGKPGDFV
jgi:hypothetical protein